MMPRGVAGSSLTLTYLQLRRFGLEQKHQTKQSDLFLVSVACGTFVLFLFLF
jgi:hypothetical protein